MDKRIVRLEPVPKLSDDPWLNVERLARVELTSEDPAFPIEAAFACSDEGRRAGWRAASPGKQLIRLFFNVPQHIRRIRLQFADYDHERTQEFVLRWSPDGKTLRDVVRQQWNFCPSGSTRELEEYRTDLVGVVSLELEIIPDVSGGEARASLAEWRLA